MSTPSLTPSRWPPRCPAASLPVPSHASLWRQLRPGELPTLLSPLDEAARDDHGTGQPDRPQHDRKVRPVGERKDRGVLPGAEPLHERQGEDDDDHRQGERTSYWASDD